jgi:LmbE family N-acetylglucosaminyl deacetylase
MSTVLVVAPHPDDESLGCGGTLLRHISEGDSVHWLIVTTMMAHQGFSEDRIAKRSAEIASVASAYGFFEVHRIGLPTTRLDTLAVGDLVSAISNVFQAIRPNTVYLPYRNDAHSDHAAVFDATTSCCKSFRHQSVKRVYAYETLSETEFGLRPDDPGFRPNLFIDISDRLERKIQILNLYAGEMGTFPFPRSEECVRAQAVLRGSQAGAHAAEAFMVLKEIR